MGLLDTATGFLSVNAFLAILEMGDTTCNRYNFGKKQITIMVIVATDFWFDIGEEAYLVKVAAKETKKIHDQVGFGDDPPCLLGSSEL